MITSWSKVVLFALIACASCGDDGVELEIDPWPIPVVGTPGAGPPQLDASRPRLDASARDAGFDAGG
jgi:hypothetical protein